MVRVKNIVYSIPPRHGRDKKLASPTRSTIIFCTMKGPDIIRGATLAHYLVKTEFSQKYQLPDIYGGMISGALIEKGQKTGGMPGP
jgi:hypothetical protein